MCILFSGKLKMGGGDLICRVVLYSSKYAMRSTTERMLDGRTTETLKSYTVLAVPMLPYGSESWNLTEQQE
jgi:hypothetical protein